MPLSESRADPNHPTLLAGCARATTAAEARYRIDAAVLPLGTTRIVALDDAAAGLLRRTASQNGRDTRPYRSHHGADGALALRSAEGADAPLDDVLAQAHAVVLVATTGAGAPAAAVIGQTCLRRGITVAGVAVGEAGGDAANAAVAALRPYSRILLVVDDGSDVFEVLSALRA